MHLVAFVRLFALTSVMYGWKMAITTASICLFVIGFWFDIHLCELTMSILEKSITYPIASHFPPPICIFI